MTLKEFIEKVGEFYMPAWLWWVCFFALIFPVNVVLIRVVL